MASPNVNLSLDELSAQYGYAAAFFNSDPELHGLISQATSGQWSAAKFQAAFMASNWYRNRAASVRQFLEEQARDPQTAARNIQQAQLKIQLTAQQMGVVLSAARLAEMGRDSLMWGWNPDEIKRAVGAELNYTGAEVGQAGSFEDQIRQAANDYGMTVSDDTVGQWTRQMAQGFWSMDNVNGQLRNWAVSKYPGLTAQLQQGMTVRQVADPYIQSYSQLMETPAGGVQLTDPLIQKALQGTPTTPTSGKSGSTALPGPSNGPPGAITPPAVQPPTSPQSLWDFERTVRSDPRWLSTKNAQQSAQTAAMGILKDWGLYK